MFFPIVWLLGFGSAHQLQKHHVQVEGWAFEMVYDRFTGSISCHANKPGVELRNGMATFHLGQHVDTSQASYRLDLGSAKGADGMRDAVTFGRALDRVSLDNPSGGEYALPLERLEGARRVDIRASANEKPLRFDISHMAEVQRVMAANQCGRSTGP